MKDQRVAYLRGALDKLVESLDATVRMARWSGTEPAPDPLRASATALTDRLGTANRLATGKYVGSPVVVKAMTSIGGAIQRLDVAFVEYRRTIDGSPTEKEEGAHALDAEIDRVRSDAATWA